MNSNIMPLAVRLPPEGKEDPQIDEIKLQLDNSPSKIFCGNELAIGKSHIEFESQQNNSEIRFTLKEFISYCENSESEELKIFRRVIAEKQNFKSKKPLKNVHKVDNNKKLSLQYPFILPLPKYISVNQQHLKTRNDETDNDLLEELKQNQITDIFQSTYNNFRTQCNGEQLNKVFKCRLRHSSEEAQVCWVLLSPTALFITINTFDDGKPCNKFMYNNIDSILYDSSYHWFAIIGREAIRGEFQFIKLNVGDLDTTTSILSHIELYAKRIQMSTTADHCRTFSTSIRNLKKGRSILLHKAMVANLPIFCQTVTERVAIQDWLFSLGRLKKDETLQKEWLILWQDGNCEEANQNSFDPIMEGHVMTRKSGFLSLWKPAYFLLKGGYLYEFMDASDQLPFQIVDVKTCRGCTRLPTSSRPHSLQIIRRKDPPILIAAADDYTVEQWLQSFLFVICSQHIEKIPITEKKMVSCQLILTENRLLILQQHFQHLMEYNVHNKNAREMASRAEVHSMENLCQNYPAKSTPLKQCRNMSNQRSSDVSLVALSESRRNVSTVLTSDNDLPSKPLSLLDLTQLNESPIMPGTLDSYRCQSLSRKEVEMKCRQQGKLLSSGNLDQISCISLIDECLLKTSCLIEFECSEAIETVGDWIIHFRTQKELEFFLDLLKDHNIQIKKMSKADSSKTKELCAQRSEKAQMEWISI